MSFDPNLLQQASDRALARCDELAQITATPGQVTRLYLTPEHKRANQLVAQWMTEAGMETWQDNVGNQCGRITGQDESAPALLLGSHLDTIPNAGRYDGILGVLLGIELVDLIAKTGLTLTRSIEVVGFCDEEGTRFGKALIGSLAIAGNWQDSWLALTDRDNVTLEQAMTDFGLSPEKAALAKRMPSEINEYWEAHIEQGPVLEAEELELGVVTGIAGARRAIMNITGLAGHAGTTPMNLRKDALCGAAEITLAVEKLAKYQSTDAVATIGKMTVKPGAVNVIAGHVSLSLDVRASDDAIRDAMINDILILATTIADKRNLKVDLEWEHSAPAVLCSQPIQARFANAIESAGKKLKHLPSGAGHDAMAIAEICPIGMLFIRSPRGLSHHPEEAVIASDVTDAITALYQALVLYNDE